MNSREIKDKQFKKSAMFGYKTVDVDEYIAEISEEFEVLEKKNAELLEKLEILAKKVRQYRANEEQLKIAILDAQKHASDIVSNATEKSDKMLADAKDQSEKMIDEAKLKSISMISDARVEYDKIVESTQNEQRGSKLALANLQREVSEFKSNLVELYKEHLSKVMAMPETIDTALTEGSSSPNENQLTLDSENNADE